MLPSSAAQVSLSNDTELDNKVKKSKLLHSIEVGLNVTY